MQYLFEDLLDQLIRRLLLPKDRNVALLVLDGGGGERGDLRSDRFYDKHYVIRICQPFVLAYLSADELARAEAIAKSGRVSLKRHGGCWLLTLPQYWEYWAPTSLNPADWPVKPAKMERHLPNGEVETLNQ